MKQLHNEENVNMEQLGLTYGISEQWNILYYFTIVQQ